MEGPSFGLQNQHKSLAPVQMITKIMQLIMLDDNLQHVEV